MKRKVKLIRVEGDVMTLKVDGVLCSYLIQRPHPLTASDAIMLRSVMDNNLLESMMRTSYSLVGQTTSPWRRIAELFSGVWKSRDRVPPLLRDYGEAAANYLEKVGVEFEPEKDVKIVAILRGDIDKIRGGKIQ